MKAGTIALLITPDGMLHYERKQDGGRISLNVPIQRFDGDDFEAGVGPAITRFDVTQPPTEVDGMWTMTVDGRVLKRVGDGVEGARHPDDQPSIST